MQLIAQFPDFFIFLALLVIGYGAGRAIEASHYRSLRAREKRFASVVIFSNRFPPVVSKPCQAELVSGSVVVSEDYFKFVVAGLQTLFGGRLRSYESLIDRARREAVLRMKEQAWRKKSDMIINIKFQTYAIPGKTLGAVELLVYGTALRMLPDTGARP
jgi:uncharacterized protein YbjQ (UPF0145 family)